MLSKHRNPRQGKRHRASPNRKASLNFRIIGPECNRQTESRSFERIVDAHAKPTADITPSRITVDRSQQPDGIEHQQLPRTVTGTRRTLRKRNAPPRVSDIRRPIRASSISCGATTNFTSGLSVINRMSNSSSGPQVEPATNSRLSPRNRSMTSIRLTLRAIRHAVEARVTGNRRHCRSPIRKAFFRLFVLHEKHLERLQRLPPPTATHLKKTESRRKIAKTDERSNPPPPQFAQQVQPKFVAAGTAISGWAVEENAGRYAAYERAADRRYNRLPRNACGFRSRRANIESQQDFVLGCDRRSCSMMGRPR